MLLNLLLLGLLKKEMDSLSQTLKKEKEEPKKTNYITVYK